MFLYLYFIFLLGFSSYANGMELWSLEPDSQLWEQYGYQKPVHQCGNGMCRCDAYQKAAMPPLVDDLAYLTEKNQLVNGSNVMKSNKELAEEMEGFLEKSSVPSLRFFSAVTVASQPACQKNAIPSDIKSILSLISLARGVQVDIKHKDAYKDFVCNNKITGIALNTPFEELKKYDFNLVFVALNKQDNESLKTLLEEPGLNINAVDRWGYTPLMFAAADGNKEAVELILKRNDVQVNRYDEFGSTALNHASMKGHSAIVALLLAHPDIVLSKNDNAQRNPLTIAIQTGSIWLMRMCLENILKK